MEKTAFVNRLKRFISDRAPESGEYQVSRRYEGQMERCEDAGTFCKALVVLDSTIEANSSSSLREATVAAMRAKRDLFNQIAYCVWNGVSMSPVGNYRLSQLDKALADTASSANAAYCFSDMYKALSPFKNSAELIILLLNRDAVLTMEEKQYIGAKKTVLLTYGVPDLTRNDLGNNAFSVLTLSE